MPHPLIEELEQLVAKLKAEFGNDPLAGVADTTLDAPAEPAPAEEAPAPESADPA